MPSVATIAAVPIACACIACSGGDRGDAATGGPATSAAVGSGSSATVAARASAEASSAPSASSAPVLARASVRIGAPLPRPELDGIGVKPLHVRPSAPPAGKLPAAAVEAGATKEIDRIRRCYEDGLRKQPSLAGRVRVAFVVGVDGSVSSVSNGGSDLGDSDVVTCIVRTFGTMTFPPPEGGVATILVPVDLAPATP